VIPVSYTRSDIHGPLQKAQTPLKCLSVLSWPVRLTAVFMALLSAAHCLRAQRVVYDQARDKTAQDAQSAAKEVTSGTLFDKMLRNVDLQGKQEIDTTMAFVEQQMRAKIENFTYWNHTGDKVVTVIPGPAFIGQTCQSVVCELKSLQIKLNAFLADSSPLTKEDIKDRLAELDEKKKALDQALKQLQDSSKSKDPLVVQTFSFINDNGKDLIGYAQKVSQLADNSGRPIKGLSSALTQVGDGLDQMLSLYNAVKGIWDGYQAVSVDPASLRPPQEQVDLQLLALEQDHLKTIALIRAREYAELSATLSRVETALNRLKDAGVLDSTDRVEDTLQQQVKVHNRERLRRLLDALNESAASVAEQDAAGRVAELRLSDEERRYSIRQSAINSSTYDQTIQAASQRLTLYWKSGVKPAELAQLIFYIANTAGVAAIAAK
jgi:hypothetical protein